MVETSRRLQSVYVPAGDGVRLAVDVWLPVERTALGGAVGTVMRVTRYHRAEAPREPGPEADTNAAAGDLFNGAGFALVVVDARGGHRLRVAIAGHDASCFTRYGPAEETFALRLGSDSHLDLPVRYG